jgi:hypothetical protein
MNTAAAIDLILNHGEKQSTYKLAVLRSLVDITIEQPSQEPRNGFHLIPVVELARRFLAYYWKPALMKVSQGVGQPKIPRLISDFASKVVVGVPFGLLDPEVGQIFADWMEGCAGLPADVRRVLLDIREVLLEQPLRYLPNVGGRRTEVFNVITLLPPGAGSPTLTDSYDDHRRAAPGRKAFRECGTWRDVLDAERTYIVLSSRAYEEITQYRYWLRDAILMRWIQACERFAGPSSAVAASVLALRRPERDPGAMDRARGLFAAIGYDRRCFYSHADLSTTYDVDHVLPFSRFPVNLFWNLVPVHPKVNGAKSDCVPRLTPALRDSLREYIRLAVGTGRAEIVGDSEWTWRKFYQQKGLGPLGSNEITDSVLAIMEGACGRLEQAGVEVWEPPTA